MIPFEKETQPNQVGFGLGTSSKNSFSGGISVPWGHYFHHLSPRVFREHYGTRRENSAGAVSDLNLHPRIQAHDELLGGGTMEVEIVVPGGFPELEACAHAARPGCRRGRPGLCAETKIQST